MSLISREVPRLFFILLFCTAVFLILGACVAHSAPSAFDQALLLMFRNSENTANPIGPAWLAVHFRDITTLGSNWFVIFTSVIGALCLVKSGYRRHAHFMLVTIGAGIIFSFLLKMGFDRPRPELVPHITKIYTSSFPSGHAMTSAMSYAVFSYVIASIVKVRAVSRIVWIATVIVVFFVGMSRIFLGVHWATDIIGGWCAGLAWYALCRLAFYRYLASRPEGTHR